MRYKYVIKNMFTLSEDYAFWKYNIKCFKVWVKQNILPKNGLGMTSVWWNFLHKYIKKYLSSTWIKQNITNQVNSDLITSELYGNHFKRFLLKNSTVCKL